jgi:nucleoside phosphorylase/CheY-like chemotaxis protein
MFMPTDFRILVIDDDASKLRNLIDLFVSNGVRREQIDAVRSAQGARERLADRFYELMILDLLLPFRDEDSAKVESALGLVDDLSDRDDLIKPRHLIGFTAYTDAELAAMPHFRKNLWTIVRFDPASDEWSLQFRRVIQYLMQATAAQENAGYGVDVCLITALREPEMAQIHRLPWRWEAPEPMDDTTFIRRGELNGTHRSHSVVSACSPRMGSVAAALLTARLVQRFRPRIVAMAGICAGIKQKVNRGDVVLFSPSWEWASGKIVRDDDTGSYLQPSPHQIAIPEFVLARAEEFKRDNEFWLRVRDEFPNHPEVLPKLVIGPGASGPSVIAHGDYTEHIRAQHRLLTAIDMEAYGVAAAAMASNTPQPIAFALKAVCDFADEQKDDSYQVYAAYTSAQALRGFLEKNIHAFCEIVDRPRT